jgi:hypothetical protein
MKKTLTYTAAAGVLLLAAAALQPAAADAAADCRLYAAMFHPNTLDAYQNELRAQEYASCMARRQQRQGRPTAGAPAADDDRPLSADEQRQLEETAAAHERGEVTLAPVAQVACTATDDGRLMIDDYRSLPPWAERDGWEVIGKTRRPADDRGGWRGYTCTIMPASPVSKDCGIEASKVPHGPSGSAVNQAYNACMARKGRPQ